MAKRRRGPTKPATPAADRGGGEPHLDLRHITDRGFEALHARLRERAGAGKKATKKADKKGQALDEALRRLQADYHRVLRRKSP